MERGEGARMKIVLVLPRLSFVSRNLEEFLVQVVNENTDQIAGVVFVNNVRVREIVACFGLALLGARKLSVAIIKNLILLLQDPRRSYLSQQRIPTLVTKSINSPQTLLWLRERRPDLVVNSRTEEIFRTEILSIPNFGCVNIHHGILPENRGMMCDLFALANGEAAGFSIHLMTQKIDAGPILHTEIVSNAGEVDFLKHVEKSALGEGKAVTTIIRELCAKGKFVNLKPNDSTNVRYFRLKGTPGEVRGFLSKGLKI
jgi:methionyl-tRNA formyltransferase